MRTSFHHQPEAQHPNFQLSTSWQADYPIYWRTVDVNGPVASMRLRRRMMKTRFTIAVSMLAGAAIGGAAIQALHAQAKPPVYMIAINQVSDQEGYAKEYVPPAQKSVKDRGGEYVAAGPGTRVAGNLPDGPVIILRWESMEALQRWLNSPEFQAALKIGEKYAKFNIVAVNGVRQ
jgi:uncharacterized protein (DUF1330 family)